MPDLPKVEQLGDARIYRIPPSGRGHLRKWGLPFFALVPLLKLRNEYDAILVSGFRVVGGTAVTVSRLLGKRCVLKADSLGEMSGEFFRTGLKRIGMSTSSPPFRLFLRGRNAILKRADAFISISEAIHDEFVQAGVPTERIRRIPNGVDIKRFRPSSVEERRALRRHLGLDPESPLAIYTGRLVEYKGLPELLRAWKRITEKGIDIKLLLVGEGGMDIRNCEPQLRSYVRVNGLTDRVTFTGAKDNVEDYLRAADMFVFPTRSEAFGISLVEAMACGLPVITTSVGGVADIVSPGNQGLVVEPDNEEQLSAAIERLAHDTALANRMRDAGLETAQRRFSSARVAALYSELFTSLCITSNLPIQQ